MWVFSPKIRTATPLNVRFSIYYLKSYINYKLARGSSAIYSAILKYDLDKFSLDILEYIIFNLSPMTRLC